MFRQKNKIARGDREKCRNTEQKTTKPPRQTKTRQGISARVARVNKIKTLSSTRPRRLLTSTHLICQQTSEYDLHVLRVEKAQPLGHADASKPEVRPAPPSVEFPPPVGVAGVPEGGQGKVPEINASFREIQRTLKCIYFVVYIDSIVTRLSRSVDYYQVQRALWSYDNVYAWY